ncbi:MAG: DUF2812 domain-containing protein [Acutalibacteraceae bacterium]
MATKKQFKWFSIFEYEKEQDYLRKMHKSGWKFVKVVGLCVYHFEKCTPEDVIYQLDYNKEGLDNKDEYVKMFNDCGWEYLQDYVGYSYFRKPVSEANGEEEIFCDDESRLQMMERVFKGKMVPLLILFFGVLIPQFTVNLLSTHKYIIAALFGSIIVLYLVVFLMCANSYSKYKNNMKK